MTIVREYGALPRNVVVVHGGPGGCGDMVNVAQKLATGMGVLEPFQSAGSVNGQIEELKTVLEEKCGSPATLIGHSWGAWLVFLLAARYPSLVKKLVLVSSGPFEASYAENLFSIRMNRLSQEEQEDLQLVTQILQNPEVKDKHTAFARFGALFAKADSYDPVPENLDTSHIRMELFESVWPDAAQLRKNGALLQAGKSIQCPVIAIHGDYDPHPAMGVQDLLSKTLKDFQFILLKKCGHKPWIEKQAKDEFFSLLFLILSK